MESSLQDKSSESPVVSHSAGTAPTGDEAAARAVTNRARKWGMFCHLTALSPLVGFPFGNLILPFIVWRLKRRSDQFIDHNGRESVNFQISMSLYSFAAILLTYFVIGGMLMIAIALIDIVLVIVAAARAGEGQLYRYPLIIRFMR